MIKGPNFLRADEHYRAADLGAAADLFGARERMAQTYTTQPKRGPQTPVMS